VRGRAYGWCGWVIAFAVITGVCARSAEAQVRGTRLATRAQLEALVDSLEQRAPTIKNDDDRRFMQQQVQYIRQRLAQGDVGPGDVVRLRVSGETRWTADFTVTPTGQLELPDVDPLDMSGTLYSEVEESIGRQLARYLREPRIDAQVLKRVGILGAVGKPGFYTVDGSSLVSDVIMSAGGPTDQAKVEDIEFRRQGRSLRHGDQLVWQNLSLDQLGIQSGDEMFVPVKGRSFTGVVFGLVTGALGIAWALTRIF